MRARARRFIGLACLGLLLSAPPEVLAEQGEIRPAVLAGTWYPADPEVLRAQVDALLGDAPAPAEPGDAPVRAVLVPHAAYRFSGAVAAAAYRTVRGLAPRRVVVLAPSHHADLHGLSLPRARAFATPLGSVPLDQEAIAQITADPLARGDPEAHRPEHGIEIQLPLLQRTLEPGWRLVPVLVGSLGAGEDARAAELLRPFLGADTLLVVSGDFTHYGPRFGYLPFPLDGSLPERLSALDEGAFARIAARDAAGLAAYRKSTGITACVVEPARVLAELLPPQAQVERVAYATSGALTGDYRNSVSYLAAAFRWDGAAPAGPADTGRIDAQGLGYLHALASAAVAASVASDAVSRERLLDLLGRVPPPLERPGAAFVTLRRAGALRGCIGTTAARDPLHVAVVIQAVNAALRDPRFPPVTAAELAGLSLEVSVLSEPRPVDSWQSIRVGQEGVVISRDGRRALFLPEVATEQGWGVEETLTQLARKAGLEPDAWRNGAALAVFTTQKCEGPGPPP